MTLTFLKPLIVRVVKTLIKSVISKAMFYWVFELYVKSTDTKIDDKILELVKAADEGDIEKTQEALKAVGLAYQLERKAKK